MDGYLIKGVKFVCLYLVYCFPLVLSAQSMEQNDTGETNGPAYEASVNNYFFTDDYIFNPIVTADLGTLHLEGRFNYEAINTLSLFAGYNIGVGNALRWDVTPMIGFAFGTTSGFIPAFESTLSYGAFEWYTEGEYVIITDEGDDNYFYAWSELNYYPLEWLSVGIIGTRTRLYESDLEVQRGFSLGYYRGSFSLMGSLMNFGFGDPYVYLSAVVAFE